MAHNSSHPPVFQMPVSEQIWDSKYRYRLENKVVDTRVTDTWSRVATAVAAAEPAAQQADWQVRFRTLLDDFHFLPGGRILAGAGTAHDVTLFNCFVMGTIQDSMDGIFDALKEGAITMQQGGGVGYDFSTLRPKGFAAHHSGTIASGPVSFMHIWDAMCATLLSTGARRGAMMATLRCDHPDIEDFIQAKHQSGKLKHFNLSILVTDSFMQAVEQDQTWQLVFPDQSLSDSELAAYPQCHRHWPGYSEPVSCRIIREVAARELWQKIMRATYEYAEPGVLFIDRINQENNLGYREYIAATNPCGEIPLPAYGACNLGSLNLTRFVEAPFTPQAKFSFTRLNEYARLAVRFLDNVIDISHFPLEAHRQQETRNRRIGLGISGLANTLMMLGLAYDSVAARELAGQIMQNLCHSAYRASIELAREKSSFAHFDADAYCQRPFIQRLPADIQQAIRQHGIRNSHLVAIAPTGTISLFANNISSGIEPVYDFSMTRRILDIDGNYKTYHIEDFAWLQWQNLYRQQPVPAYFQTATAIDPQAHLHMQAALQPYVDNAISKTINIPEDFPFDKFTDLYRTAYQLGTKGCTTYRPNPVTGAILSKETLPSNTHCCSIDREAD